MYDQDLFAICFPKFGNCYSDQRVVIPVACCIVHYDLPNTYPSLLSANMYNLKAQDE